MVVIDNSGGGEGLCIVPKLVDRWPHCAESQATYLAESEWRGRWFRIKKELPDLYSDWWSYLPANRMQSVVAHCSCSALRTVCHVAVSLSLSSPDIARIQQFPCVTSRCYVLRHYPWSVGCPRLSIYSAWKKPYWFLLQCQDFRQIALTEFCIYSAAIQLTALSI